MKSHLPHHLKLKSPSVYVYIQSEICSLVHVPNVFNNRVGQQKLGAQNSVQVPVWVAGIQAWQPSSVASQDALVRIWTEAAELGLELTS